MTTLRQLRNFWIPWVTTIVLACFNDAVAQTSYKVTDLGVLNNWNLSCAMALNNHGWTLSMNGLMDPVSNFIAAPIVTGHAVINIDGLKIDLRTLGGPNSWMNWGGINDRGEAVGFAETSVPDPNGGYFCTSQGAFTTGTGLTCRPFLWQNGHMSALPTLGGNNGSASDINNGGQIVGTAQTTVTDSGCPPNKTHLPVLWQKGKAQPLPTVGSDPDGDAFWINDQGQAVGDSRNCSGAIIHAVSWENGTASPLPDFETGAVAYGNNNQGQIVGTVGSADGTTQSGALWQNGALTNLGLLPGDFGGIATGINNQGQVVGSNWDSGFNWSHAFIWQDGVMTDLNTLFPASSNLFATMANKINERGQISGMATVLSGPHAGDIHAFLATPVNASMGTSVAEVARTHPKSNLPANVGKQLLQRFRLGQFGR
jgi:probable HAF family extracellular repeat protein